VITAALVALVTHIQVVPALSPDYDVTGAILYAEPTPDSRYTLSVTHSDIKGFKVQVGARFKF
jgi:hypothetical protein